MSKKRHKFESMPDVFLWPADVAPAAIKTLFQYLPPPGSWVARISRKGAKDIWLEATLRVHGSYGYSLITRTSLKDGGVALLFAPKEPNHKL